MTENQALALAEAVVDDGFDAHRGELTLFIADARNRGARGTLTQVAEDPMAPAVARHRALARIILQHYRLH